MSPLCVRHVQRSAWTFIALAVLVAAAVVPVAAGTTGASNAATGTLSLSATLSMQSLRGSFCPAGTAETVECFKRTGSGPDERQVRAALKTLTITGEAIRAARGLYLPRASATASVSRPSVTSNWLRLLAAIAAFFQSCR